MGDVQGAAPAGALWYFAYGANMSRRVLARRGLAPRSSEPARLDGYRLRFSHAGLIALEPAFANLEPDPRGAVHGALHLLAREDMDRLDRIEGAEYLHVDVPVTGRDAGVVTARAYLDPHPVDGRRPSRRYLRCCCEGARELGLPDDYVAGMAAHPSLHVPVVSDLATLFVGVAERLRRAGLRPERLRMARRGVVGRKDGVA
jgi:sulfite reductase (NADPH) flavoprotein alpha-component